MSGLGLNKAENGIDEKGFNFNWNSWRPELQQLKHCSRNKDEDISPYVNRLNNRNSFCSFRANSPPEKAWFHHFSSRYG